MRKIVILLVLVLSIVGCYVIAVEGVDYNFLEIASYDEVKAANKELDTQISELNRKNTTEFESKRTALTTAVKNYKDKKAQYEALAPTVQQEEEVPEETTSNTKTYDVDFLWTIVGNYATSEGINLDFVFVKSAESSSSIDTEYYTMADINFTISGNYNSLIEFMYDIEEDDRLAFEIRNFKMSKGGSDIQATFSVVGIPINNENLTSFTSQTATDNGTGTVSNTTGNTVDGNTVVDNTANTTNTENTSNTTDTANAVDNTNATNSTNTAQ